MKNPRQKFLAIGSSLIMALVFTGCASKVDLNAGRDSGNTGAADTSRDVAAVTAGADGANANMSAAEAALRTIYFDFDSYTVKPEFQNILQRNASYIKANGGSVALEGHADLRGTREYNLALGQKRADAVRQALSLMGVADSQMESISFGKEKPVSESWDEDSQARNRRVEIVYR